ncbi:hypothetical protein KPH14_005874 [Odynerus spinipes]|uniref:Cuticle protein 6 n=1 Tax=Odynerus spinipes TaxID=1348599 RepID=A0AAD9RCE3_9HYME|nr:hypothetical protein KPH14_005874 [Odynerus spinipes]
MQSLIPFLAILSAVSCSQLTLVPYAYLADPLPVYHQSQDTRTGEHAYSYAGGPSAKEEVKGPDGVTRGSYSYVDAHGILQSVFYVADEGGFRVAATNLPTDSDLPSEPAEIFLAKRAVVEEQAKSDSGSRRKRSVSGEESAKKVEEPKDDKKPTVEAPKQEEDTGRPYGALASFLLPGSIPTATSHQSHIQIHQNVRTEPAEPVANAVTVEAAPVVSLPGIPIATSHQSRVQIHNTPAKLETVDVFATPVAAGVPAVPVIPSDYHQNRILIHRNLGLEGEQRKDAVKIETPTLLGVHALVSEPVAILEHRPSFFTAVSSQSTAQIHTSDRLAIPTFSTNFYQFPAFLHSVPLATSSQYRSQVHSGQRIESADGGSLETGRAD